MAAVFGVCLVGPVPFGSGYSTVFGNSDIIREIPLPPPSGLAGSVSFGTVPVVAIAGYGDADGFSTIVIAIPFGNVSIGICGDLFKSNVIVSAGSTSPAVFGQISMVTPKWR